MVVACLALTVALGGTGYAAIKLPKNSVGTKQLKKNAVVSSKVKNRSLKAVDFAAGQLPKGAKGASGATGPTGPTGPSDAWEASSPGATNVTSTPKVLSVTVPAGSYDVTGKAEEQNRDQISAGSLHCRLWADSTVLDDMYSVALYYSGTDWGYGSAANVVHAGYTTSTGTTFKLSCANAFSSWMFVNNPTLSAIKVGTLH
jgi:hypothetical protein